MMIVLYYTDGDHNKDEKAELSDMFKQFIFDKSATVLFPNYNSNHAC